MPTFNGRNWTVADFNPFNYFKNWDAFFGDVRGELDNFQGSSLSSQAAAAAASASTSAARAAAAAGTAGTGTATGLAYAALTKSLASATDVVAVYVYDTGNDSDGGAWTERCRGTSWYNEALNTATRGATRRFPRVALIVAKQFEFTIYDAHDLDAGGVPRLWRRWAPNGTIDNGLVTAGMYALNGRIYISKRHPTYPSNIVDGHFVELNLLNDVIYRSYINLTFEFNSTTNFSSSYSRVNYNKTLASSSCNAVHARVFPGAPTDAAGLPIPTVAVATSAGLSVIHPWGDVFDITYAGGYRAVQFGVDGRLELSASDAARIDFGPIPYADIANSAWRQGTMAPSAAPAILAPTSTSRAVLAGSSAVGSADGLTLRAPDTASLANGMTAFVTANYITGWQPGDIRGAWLCDTTTGSISAAVLLSYNGSSTAELTALHGASLTSVSGALRITGGAEVNPGAYATVTTVAGVSYVLTVDYAVGTAGSVIISVVDVASGGSLGARTLTTGTRTIIGFTATGTATQILLFAATGIAGQYADFDNVLVETGAIDRSYRRSGMAVRGTLSRTALPCGVAYWSGWSAANYLEQLHTTDLDFGTGDWHFGLWFRPTAPDNATLFELAAYSSGSYTGPAIRVDANIAADVQLHVSDDGWGTTDIVARAAVATIGVWHHLVAIRRGSQLELWMDGIRIGPVAISAAADSLTNAAATLRVGVLHNGLTPADLTQITMLRIGAYAPTPAQIRRMYDDERALIIGGQPATLGGTSNNVTALATNDATGTLAVGTGDGVSLFSGLARTAYLDGASGGAAIGNDAITALSASGPHLLIGTSANAGLISDAVIARDQLGSTRQSAARDPQVMQARAVTVDATPTDMVPRVHVGEREAVVVEATIQARAYGASASQGGVYKRLARYIRDAGGNLTLAGSVQTLGSDQETTAGMDATLVIDTAAQTITPRVTGVAGTRVVWSATIMVTRISEDQIYI